MLPIKGVLLKAELANIRQTGAFFSIISKLCGSEHMETMRSAISRTVSILYCAICAHPRTPPRGGTKQLASSPLPFRECQYTPVRRGDKANCGIFQRLTARKAVGEEHDVVRSAQAAISKKWPGRGMLKALGQSIRGQLRVGVRHEEFVPQRLRGIAAV